MSDFAALASLAIALFAFAGVILWTNPRARPALEGVGRTISSRSNFLVLGVWLLPFGLAVLLVENPLSGAFFSHWGRLLFPLAYMHVVEPTGGLYPIVQSETHLWDILAWAVVSVLFGFATQKMRFAYALLIAPIAIAAVSFLFHLIAQALGLQFWVWGWGLPRLVG